MKNWLQTSQFNFIKTGVIRQYYCCDFKENVFGCLAKFQVVIFGGNMYMFAGIIKKQDKNLIIVNKDNKIDCFSKNVEELFGVGLKNKDVDCIMRH